MTRGGSQRHKKKIPNLVAALYKVCVCCRSLAGIAGSNPSRVTDVCLFCVLCVVRKRSLRWADHSYREVVQSVVLLSAVVKLR